MSNLLFKDPPFDEQGAEVSQQIDQALHEDRLQSLTSGCKILVVGREEEREALISHFGSIQGAKFDTISPQSDTRASFPLECYGTVFVESVDVAVNRRTKRAFLSLSRMDPSVILYVVDPAKRDSISEMAQRCRDSLEEFSYLCSTLGDLSSCYVCIIFCSSSKINSILTWSEADSFEEGFTMLRNSFLGVKDQREPAQVFAAVLAEFELTAEAHKAKHVRSIPILGKIERYTLANSGKKEATPLAQQVQEVLNSIQEVRVRKIKNKDMGTRRKGRKAKNLIFTSPATSLLIALAGFILYYSFIYFTDSSSR